MCNSHTISFVKILLKSILLFVKDLERFSNRVILSPPKGPKAFMIKSLVPFSLSTNFKKAGLLALNNSAGLYGAAKSCAPSQK